MVFGAGDFFKHLHQDLKNFANAYSLGKRFDGTLPGNQLFRIIFCETVINHMQLLNSINKPCICASLCGVLCPRTCVFLPGSQLHEAQAMRSREGQPVVATGAANPAKTGGSDWRLMMDDDATDEK